MAQLSVRRLVRTRNLRALAVQLALLAVIADLYVNFHREVHSRIFGPYPVSADEIASIQSLPDEPRRFFRLDEAALIPVRIRDVTVHTRRGRETGRTFTYYFAVRGKRTLLIRSKEENPQLPLLGVLRTVQPEFERRLWSYHSDLTGPGVAPLLFETEDPVFSLPSFMTAVVLVTPVILLFYLFRTLARLRNFRRSPAVASLVRLGAPIDQLVAQIDAELAKGNPVTPMRRVLLTQSWLVHKQVFKLALLHLNEILWVYAVVNRRYIYWFIPVSTSTYVRIGTRDGRLLNLKGRKKHIPAVITAIVQRVPWVIAGHSADLERTFRWERNAFTAAVDQRRQQGLAAPPPPPATS